MPALCMTSHTETDRYDMAALTAVFLRLLAVDF